MADIQCQALIFCGSADNSHAQVLQPYVGGKAKRKEIVLVEGPPFAKELSVLKDKFITTCFPDVFRDTKLPSRRISFSLTHSPTPISRPSNYAATVGSPVILDQSRQTSTTTFAPARTDYPILQNSKGQRIEEILHPPQSLVQAQRNKKLCNAYHILGVCRYSNSTKNFVHGISWMKKGLKLVD
jgi:hypothetical protein